MSRKQFFMRSKFIPAGSWQTCDDCDRHLAQVDDTASYYNPSRRARIKNICAECYAFRMKIKEERRLEHLSELEQMDTDLDLAFDRAVRNDP